jgi:integrase
MAKTAKFTPTKVEGKGWRLSIPPKYSQTGKREQHFFRTKALTETAIADMKLRQTEYGTQAKSIAPSLAEMATAAALRLEPYGVTITDLVNRYIEAETRNRQSVPIETALTEFRTAKDGRSDSQTTAYKMMADRLIEDFAGRSMASITGDEIEKHIEERTRGAHAFNQRRSLVCAFVRWSAKRPRTWCDADIVSHIEKRETISGHIGTLTPAQCRSIMQAAEAHFPDCVPAFAIALFTGMRQKEIARLQAHDITPDGITVPAISSKTKRRRFIAMSAPLAAWLKVYPIGNTVTPPNWVRKEKGVRRLAGFSVWCDILPKMNFDPPMPAEPPRDAPAWIDNALRHTAATVALALGKPIETLVFEHGHSGGLTILRNHYIGQLNKKQALEIWSIGPNGTKVSNMAVA